MAKEKLVILWTSGERETAETMVFMYAQNSLIHDWWQDVTLVVWGASAKLLGGDEELQEQLFGLKKEGVRLEACKVCAEMGGVSEQLTALGIDVKYMGEVLTSYIKEDRHILTV